MNRLLFRYLVMLFVAVLISAPIARADEDQGDDDYQPPSNPVQNSPQVMDPRLPPVLPGQEVTVNGNQMDVWSTSGEVAGAQPTPSNYQGNMNQQLQGADVIVDQRPFGRGGVPRR